MRRALVIIGFVYVLVATSAAPAAAHGVGGREPTNLETRLTDIEPAIAGVTARVVELGTKIELRNESASEVVVLGYDGEPYLRIGPGGVYENTRSPAVFVNRSLDPPSDIPASYDSEAAPQWRHISSNERVRWHDHRAHWMSDDTPEGTVPWSIDLLVAGERTTVRGEFESIPAPPWWPWLLLALAIGITVVLTARWSWRLVATTTLAALLVGELLHVLGSWSEVASTFDDRLAAQAVSAVALVAGSLALWRVVRADEYVAAPWVLISAIALGVVAAGDVLVLTRSQIPSSLTPAVVRTLVALALGGATGLAIAAASKLRAPAVRGEELRL